MRLNAVLAGRRIGRQFDHFDELPSTNTHLLSQPAETSIDGRVVVAEFQSGGRGRHGSRWHCPRGAGILCSVGVDDANRGIDAGLLALVVPVALCEGIAAATRVHCAIDWPNDIVVDERKLAGVLIEAHASGPAVRFAIGFGINCLQHAGHFPEELRRLATSLDLVTDEPVDRTAVLLAVLTALDNRLARSASWDAATIRGAWLSRALGLGRRVQATSEGRRYLGHLVDIDPTSAIVVQLDEGGRRLFSAASTTLDWVR